jgi:hypothetical protein
VAGASSSQPGESGQSSKLTGPAGVSDKQSLPDGVQSQPGIGKKQRKVFKCAKCAKMFLSIDHLQKHMLVRFAREIFVGSVRYRPIIFI